MSNPEYPHFNLMHEPEPHADTEAREGDTGQRFMRFYAEIEEGPGDYKIMGMFVMDTESVRLMCQHILEECEMAESGIDTRALAKLKLLASLGESDKVVRLPIVGNSDPTGGDGEPPDAA